MRCLYSLDSIRVAPLATEGSEAEQAELREIIQREIRRLPAKERDAILALARVSGESCRTVAKRYGKTPQTVCNWAASAAAKLRPRYCQ